ncbi:MAG: sporulation integral membrane protein YtvI, partial [Desulfotomaculaceae bacterium]
GIRFLQKKAKMSRGIATLTAMLVVFGSFIVILSVIILQLISELIQLSISLPALTLEIKGYSQGLIEKATAFYIALPPSVSSSIEQNINNLAASLQGLLSKAANSLLLFISMVPGTIAVLVVSLLATYFLARDRRLIADFILRLLPASWGEKTVAVTHDVAAAFTAYLKAQALLVSITTVLSVTGLYMIGADYALIMGLSVGFFDLIPVLGPATIFVPWLIWSFATGATGFGIKITVLYLLVLLVRQVLETKIVSANLGLHPLATLLAMYAGLKTIGLTGLVLGPILLIAIQSLYKAGVLIPRR